MNIPSKFRKIIEQDSADYEVLMNGIHSFEPVLSENKLYFFEEYTDHGIKHVENVLNAAEYLISDHTLTLLTSKEITVLILAIVLHDLGMHAGISTFRAMLQGKYDRVRNNTLDRVSWKTLWENYLEEARRFSSVDKINIFGDESYVFSVPDLENSDRLTGKDKKLIGEFLRRYHARIAEEIGRQGLWNDEKEIISFGDTGMPPYFKDLAGILARSHGMSVRDTFPYLRELNDERIWANPEDIRIVFLMIVLRIADYLQIDAGRTNGLLLKLKTFHSPLSRKEHDTHLAIQHISVSQQDPERIYVTCKPENSEMYVKLVNLIESIQGELDRSWAIMGEVYQGFPDVPCIRYRRIVSNLEVPSFIEKLDFVPQKMAFQVNSELSPLLIAPLYGNNPTFGVRELVQNAVDACLERHAVMCCNSETGYIPLVEVDLQEMEDNTCVFSISDNGKGMSINEIKDYFLTVGASFRKSLAWRKEFVDESGNGKINRNGRFGIGILAAFLLGEEIEVKTRHFRSEILYSFKTNLSCEFIEVGKHHSLDDKEIGTTIKIRMSNQVKEQLLRKDLNAMSQWFEWYVLDYPEIIYRENGKRKSFKQFKEVCTHCFSTNEYPRVSWTYDWAWNRKRMCIVCNGIIISRNIALKKKRLFMSIYKDIKRKEQNVVIPYKPTILLEDPNACLPVKLDRSDIDVPYFSFEEKLFTEVSKDFIACFLTLNVNRQFGAYYLGAYNANVLLTKNGFALDFDYFTDRLKNKNYKLIRISTKDKGRISENYTELENVVVIHYSHSLCARKKEIAGRIWTGGACIKAYGRLAEELLSSDSEEYRVLKRKGVQMNFESGQFEISCTEADRFDTKELEQLYAGNKSLEGIEMLQQLNWDYVKKEGGNILSDLLQKYIGEEVIIPYSMDERKVKFASAFEDLSRYMDYYLKSDVSN